MIELDPELLEWVRDFIREQEWVTVDDVRREFFPDEVSTPYLYLDALHHEGIVKRDRQREAYEWIHKPTQKTKRSTRRGLHRDCQHPNTQWEREKCRRSQGGLDSKPADLRKRMLRSKWAQFVDGEIHYLTAEQIQELTSLTTTLRQFESRIRSYASNYAIRCSTYRAGNGLRFVLDPGILFDLPPDALMSRHVEPVGPPRVVHAACDHLSTKAARAKCNSERAASSR